jgi:hypothetical protein
MITLAIALFSLYRNRTSRDKELIIGELLDNEDVQLITDEKAIIFQNDIEVTLKGEGSAEIVQANNETSKVQVARDKLNSLIVPYGKRSTLILADGSRVWLNSGSILEFPSQFSGKKREITPCVGRDVCGSSGCKEKPFFVLTGNVNVKYTELNSIFLIIPVQPINSPD